MGQELCRSAGRPPSANQIRRCQLQRRTHARSQRRGQAGAAHHHQAMLAAIRHRSFTGQQGMLSACHFMIRHAGIMA